MAKVKLGRNHRLYRNTGTYGSPVWTLITYVRDVTVPLTKTEIDTSSRASEFLLLAGGLIAAGVTFEILDRDSDATLGVLIDAFLASTAIEFLVLNGPVATVGSTGLRMTCEVFDVSGSEPLDGAATKSVTIKPTEADNPPAKFTVT